jgi:hypothetical protein
MTKAQKMYEVLKKAPIGKATDKKLMAWVNDDDPDAIWAYFQECIKRKPEVGESIESNNLTSFEQLKYELEKVYRTK